MVSLSSTTHPIYTPLSPSYSATANPALWLFRRNGREPSRMSDSTGCCWRGSPRKIVSSGSILRQAISASINM
ncbi:hypothetical protein K503DRAFT_484255 [Rhizopogon vinicolor AM-OR11-026]|uniref:Uncharacterized protein n=1 Tax=Rhizopogon vinicolor AM-OR11-026 TaxID=1314800 RepID=A0A1B7MMQ8_9AGAM|nr:hypothetical protein K503DRAFT_484255 [Rhizopogon vinicolor AM-OR11-026]